MAALALPRNRVSILMKIWVIVLIYLKDNFAYPVASGLWVLADAQAAIILPAVWMAAAGPNGMVAGFDRSGIVTYYLVSMALAQFITCHLMWDIAWDIREGFFSSQLVRPIDYFLTQTGRNFAWRLTKLILFVPLYAVVIASYAATVHLGQLHFSLAFVVSVFLAQQLSFVSAYCMAMVTLWTTEFESVLRLYYIPEFILSGRTVPLSSLPIWAGSIATYTHFKYTNSFPAEMLLGRVNGAQQIQGLAIQASWIFVFILLSRILFVRGTRHYTGVGM